MPKKNENPFLNPDFTKQLENSLPPNHPANENPYLTQLQSFAFPVLLWFFDSNRNLGQGRSYLMAAICIELAKRGQEINIEDCSIIPHHTNKKFMNKYFIDIIWQQIKEYHKNDIFEFNQARNTLIYKGRRPK